MTVARPAFVALIPEPSWRERILACKAQVRAAAGPQRYLDDPPHLTVFLALFPDVDAIVPHLQRWCATLPAIAVDIRGWHVFRDDPLTGGHTVVCAIAEAGQTMLRGFQGQAISAIASLRDAAASRDRYSARWSQLTAARQQSVTSCGFPFSGADWQPHVSIGSMAPAQWGAVWSVLAPREPRGVMRFSEVHWYELIDGMPHLHTRFTLPHS